MFNNKLKFDKLWIAYLAFPKENPLYFFQMQYNVVRKAQVLT